MFCFQFAQILLYSSVSFLIPLLKLRTKVSLKTTLAILVKSEGYLSSYSILYLKFIIYTPLIDIYIELYSAERSCSKLSSSLWPYVSESRSILIYCSFVKARSKSRGLVKRPYKEGCLKTKLLRWALQCQVLWSLKKPQLMPC